MATTAQNYGTYVALAVTNLLNLANSATAGWKSPILDLQTSLKANDYEFVVKMHMADTAPANDKAVTIFVAPAVTIDGGTTWLISDQGTATLLDGSEGTTTIAEPNNMRVACVLNYTTQHMTMIGCFNLASIFATMPDGVVFVVKNYTGAAIGNSAGDVVFAFRPIKTDIA